MSPAPKTNAEQQRSASEQSQQQEPYSNYGRQELLWHLFDRTLDSLCDAFKRAEETGKPMKSAMLLVTIAFLKWNGIKVERTSRGLSRGLSAISNALDPFKNQMKPTINNKDEGEQE